MYGQGSASNVLRKTALNTDLPISTRWKAAQNALYLVERLSVLDLKDQDIHDMLTQIWLGLHNETSLNFVFLDILFWYFMQADNLLRNDFYRLVNRLEIVSPYYGLAHDYMNQIKDKYRENN